MTNNNDWKFRRDTFYALHSGDFTDSVEKNYENLKVIERWDPSEIVEDAINYAIVHTDEMYYPGKSYMIAVQYASWIQDHFGGELLELLDDPELLPDDPYFVRYSESKDIYDRILDFTDKYGQNISVKDDLPYLQKTYEYFLEEFLLDEKGLTILPRT
jgi:hypothetical protein